MLEITLDTNASLERTRKRIENACLELAVDLRHTTVTDRESGLGVVRAASIAETAVWDESIYDGGAIYAAVTEPAVLTEWRLGEAALTEESSAVRFEAILKIITNGSFPAAQNREQLSDVERGQLRDAIILEAHTRDGRDIFVSDDRKAFVDHGRREKLETLCETKILTVDEFCEYAAAPPLRSERGSEHPDHSRLS